ncbi:MAG: class I adenylate-forming enzyme family protein [Phreatobacter sp.]|uniref:class I adenylate-forming enzyme family protein n=1 Tax=Phreatobacter sp. TaxID=1966341 RepID=UPI0027334963|nr:class I adenylate-forming enzyme family protein [Phreatobacter sp.]MDP2800529.1 class I adenylate-forming enzyme family protein [Phreatobacter sp.]
MPPDGSDAAGRTVPRWIEPGGPDLRLEAHFGDRVVACFAERPASLHALLADAATRHPLGEAIVCEATRLTYADLAAAVDRLSAALAAEGVRPSDRVAMLIGNRTEFVTVLFAVTRLGAIAVPMGLRLQTPEIAHVLADCGASLLIHEADLVDRLPQPVDIPALARRWTVGGSAAGTDGFDAILARHAAAPVPPVVPVEEEDTAVILYTSGTTGRPKGAMLTHLGLVHSSLVYEHCMGLTKADRSLAAVPLSHVTGLVANVTCTVRAAATLVIMPAFRAGDFLVLAARERMTQSVLVPAMYNLCLLQPDFASHDLSAWRIGGYGGAPMPTPTIERLADHCPGLMLMNAYGATETTSPTTIMPPRFTPTHGHSVGIAAPGVDIVVVDDRGREVPPGAVGEIWIRGPHVVRGYWNNPAATQAGFTAGFWHSGDIGSIDADGFVQVLDRKKDMINRGGYKIFTAEVETILIACPGVVECAVVAVPCPVLGERVHAFVVTDGSDPPAETLRAWCAARLSDYKVPETMTIQAEPLPRNANGKVMKRVLREGLPPAGTA